MKYTSPQALLNRYFKKRNAFKMTISELDCYENKDWHLTHIDEERFVLSRRVQEHDTGADYFEDCFFGELSECLKIMIGVK